MKTRRRTSRTRRATARRLPIGSLEEMAEEILDLTRISTAREVKRRGGVGPLLSNPQFFTLDLLHRHGVMTVGQLKRRIGVLPAQMSRILRSLEHYGEEAFIQCAINPSDKRRVDVTLTEAGRRAYYGVRQAKLANTVHVLGQLPPEELATFITILRNIKALMTKPASYRSDGKVEA